MSNYEKALAQFKDFDGRLLKGMIENAVLTNDADKNMRTLMEIKRDYLEHPARKALLKNLELLHLCEPMRIMVDMENNITVEPINTTNPNT